MKRILFLLLLSSTMYVSHVFGQKSFNDERVSVTSEVLKYEDQTNDKFYNYYNFTVKNVSSENLKFELVINYKQNEENRSSKTRDESLTFELAPGETMVGDIQNKTMLTLFKSFLPGKSGKKASEDNVEVESIEINYL